ncbi:type II secretion system minor pseudopilin GspK [Curvibacter sp. APW13]|uniref:type II secretion system minor pseudopilin GspK n=1 Tax=Curvibacter sp. APW13 TaxID=3077236 RepID=UPI0028DF5483|nr:type II secretion system minor pseudopilin GspK [Curvibacter sp. APW13]MDT8992557.1 type II secretion system minor pseudopilin GspK [Curvibacter sp. APW13]
MSSRRHQRGAAILLAMLIVALVAALSAGAVWRQWRNIAVQSAEQQRLQAAWILQGTTDWARLLLREDAREGAVDHLGEPWAVPLAEARLSTFLASGQGATDTSTDLPEAFLSGRMQDLQARLNVTSLLDGTSLHAPTVRAFTRLWRALALPEAELLALTSQLQRSAQEPAATPAGGGDAPLSPRSVAQLQWLGLSAATVQRLAPYVAVLPERTPVNLNTAPPIVLHAVIDKLALVDAQRLASARSQKYFRSLSDVTQALGGGEWVLEDAQHGVNSRYFEVVGQMRLQNLRVLERSLVQRDGLSVRVLSSERLAPAGTGVNQSAASTP